MEIAGPTGAVRDDVGELERTEVLGLHVGEEVRWPQMIDSAAEGTEQHDQRRRTGVDAGFLRLGHFGLGAARGGKAGVSRAADFADEMTPVVDVPCSLQHVAGGLTMQLAGRQTSVSFAGTGSMPFSTVRSAAPAALAARLVQDEVRRLTGSAAVRAEVTCQGGSDYAT